MTIAWGKAKKNVSVLKATSEIISASHLNDILLQIKIRLLLFCEQLKS